MEIKNKTWQLEGNSGFYLCFQKEQKVEFKGFCQTRPRLFYWCSTGEWKGEYISSRPEVDVWCPSVVLARPSGRSYPVTEPLHCPWMDLTVALLHPLRRHWNWGPCPAERENSQEVDQKAKPETHRSFPFVEVPDLSSMGLCGARHPCTAEESGQVPKSVPEYGHVQEQVPVHSPSAAPRHALRKLSCGLEYGLLWRIWIAAWSVFGWNEGVECKLQSREARVLLHFRGWFGQQKAERHGPTRYWALGASNYGGEGGSYGRVNVEGGPGK